MGTRLPKTFDMTLFEGKCKITTFDRFILAIQIQSSLNSQHRIRIADKEFRQQVDFKMAAFFYYIY